MKISTNLIALQTVTALKKSDRNVLRSSLKMSSGYKINSSKDDAAGMAMAQKMDKQVAKLQMASRNSLDGVSLIQTADGALSEMTNMLQRIRELSVQAANEVLEPEDLETIQYEIDSLKDEINALTNKTEFNNIKPLNGSGQRLKFGNNDYVSKINYVSETVSPGNFRYDIQSVGVPAKVSASYPFSTGAEGELMLNNNKISISASDSSDDILNKLINMGNKVGIKIIHSGSEIHMITKDAGSAQKINIQVSDPILEASLGIHNVNVNGIDASINNVAFYDLDGNLNTNFNSTMSVLTTGNRLDIRNNNNQKVSIDIQLDINNDGTFSLKDGTQITDAGIISSAITMGGSIKNFGPIIIQVGSEKKMEMEIVIPEVTTEALGIDGLNVLSTMNAVNAMDLVDKALQDISSIRSKLGAFQNRLEFTDNTLQVSAENSQISLSRIWDTDMAAQMTEYTKQMVINQAGISILSQANQRPQQILQLL